MHSLILPTSIVAIVASACTSEPAAHQPIPADGLLGQWHYDSVGFASYDSASQRYLGREAEPMRAGALLTIRDSNWVYSGSVRELHSYARRGHRLRLSRIGTPDLLRGGHIRPEQVGHRLFTYQFDLVALTPQRLVVRDSSGLVDPNGYPQGSVTVRRFYYSR